METIFRWPRYRGYPLDAVYRGPAKSTRDTARAFCRRKALRTSGHVKMVTVRCPTRRIGDDKVVHQTFHERNVCVSFRYITCLGRRSSSKFPAVAQMKVTAIPRRAHVGGRVTILIEPPSGLVPRIGRIDVYRYVEGVGQRALGTASRQSGGQFKFWWRPTKDAVPEVIVRVRAYARRGSDYATRPRVIGRGVTRFGVIGGLGVSIRHWTGLPGEVIRARKPVNFVADIKGGRAPFRVQWLIDGLPVPGRYVRTSSKGRDVFTSQIRSTFRWDQRGNHTVRVRVRDRTGMNATSITRFYVTR
jgi:hypothetical protein